MRCWHYVPGYRASCPFMQKQTELTANTLGKSKVPSYKMEVFHEVVCALVFATSPVVRFINFQDFFLNAVLNRQVASTASLQP